MNDSEIIKRHYAKIGAKGGRSGTGEAKRRKGSADNLRKYWEDVRAGLRDPPARRGRLSKKNKPLAVVVQDELAFPPSDCLEKDDSGGPFVMVDADNKLVKNPRNLPCPCGSGLKWKKCCHLR